MFFYLSAESTLKLLSTSMFKGKSILWFALFEPLGKLDALFFSWTAHTENKQQLPFLRMCALSCFALMARYIDSIIWTYATLSKPQLLKHYFIKSERLPHLLNNTQGHHRTTTLLLLQCNTGAVSMGHFGSPSLLPKSCGQQRNMGRDRKTAS